VQGFRRQSVVDSKALHLHVHGHALKTPLAWLGGRAQAGLEVVAVAGNASARWLRRYAWALLGVALLAWLGSGLHAVGVGEQGLHLCFGRFSAEALGPGLHYHPPAPLCDHLVEQVTRQRRIALGFSERAELPDQSEVPRAYLWDGAASHGPWPKIDEEALKLTGESTIIDLSAVVAYRIRDLRRWLLTAEDPEGLLRAQLLGFLVRRLAAVRLDAALTERRA